MNFQPKFATEEESLAFIDHQRRNAYLLVVIIVSVRLVFEYERHTKCQRMALPGWRCQHFISREALRETEQYSERNQDVPSKDHVNLHFSGADLSGATQVEAIGRSVADEPALHLPEYKNAPPITAGRLKLMPDDDLLSHGETPNYHRR